MEKLHLTDNSLNRHALFLIIFLCLPEISCYAQSYPIKALSYDDNNVVVKLRMIDTLYRYGDTILVQYKAINGGSEPMYIFIPDCFNATTRVRDCSHDFDLGGTWYFDYGHLIQVPVTKVSPGATYSGSIKFVVVSGERCSQYVRSEINESMAATHFIGFFVAYYNGSNELRIRNSLESPVDGEIKLDYDQITYLNGHLRRFHLGTFEVMIRAK